MAVIPGTLCILSYQKIIKEMRILNVIRSSVGKGASVTLQLWSLLAFFSISSLSKNRTIYLDDNRTIFIENVHLLISTELSLSKCRLQLFFWKQIYNYHYFI